MEVTHISVFFFSHTLKFPASLFLDEVVLCTKVVAFRA